MSQINAAKRLQQTFRSKQVNNSPRLSAITSIMEDKLNSGSSSLAVHIRFDAIKAELKTKGCFDVVDIAALAANHNINDPNLEEVFNEAAIDPQVSAVNRNAALTLRYTADCAAHKAENLLDYPRNAGKRQSMDREADRELRKLLTNLEATMPSYVASQSNLEVQRVARKKTHEDKLGKAIGIFKKHFEAEFLLEDSEDLANLRPRKFWLGKTRFYANRDEGSDYISMLMEAVNTFIIDKHSGMDLNISYLSKIFVLLESAGQACSADMRVVALQNSVLKCPGINSEFTSIVIMSKFTKETYNQLRTRLLTKGAEIDMLCFTLAHAATSNDDEEANTEEAHVAKRQKYGNGCTVDLGDGRGDGD